MWLSAFCASLILAGFGCEDQTPEPQVPLSITASVHGRGSTGMLVVQVIAKEEAPHAKVQVGLPEGVSFIGQVRNPEADMTPGKPYQFRFPVRAAKPGAYIIEVKVMAGSESYRFGRSISVAWIAQSS